MVSATPPGTAGVGRYLKEAFRFHWNQLLFWAGLGAALLSPWPDAVLPLVAAGEIAFLAGLVSRPRFRSAIDAKVHAERMGVTRAVPGTPVHTFQNLVESLLPDHRQRFDGLRRRCLEMQNIAQAVRGGLAPEEGQQDERAPALDRMLWVFLRLLVSQQALNQFLRTTTEGEIAAVLEQLQRDLAQATSSGDDRIVQSLKDSVAVTELRLDNYRKAQNNARFVAIELDRIEGKIRALTEMAVNRQDPDFLSSQVDAVADSVRQTENAIKELQQITGLAQELEEPPPILAATRERLTQR